MFKQIVKKIKDRFVPVGTKLVGEDRLGNRYFVHIDPKTGNERRSVECPDMSILGTDIPDMRNIPVEWSSWLSFIRRDAPTPQLSAYLEEDRKIRAENAKSWQEEMERAALQAQMAGRGGAPASQGSDGPGGDNLRPSFDYIAKQLHLEQGSETSMATVSATSDNSGPSASSTSSIHISVATVAAAGGGGGGGEFGQQSVLSPHSVQPYSPFAGDGYDYTRSTVPSSELHTYREHGYTQPVDYKGIDPSNLSTVENRDIQRQYSQSRTSKYAGKRPVARTTEQIEYVRKQQLLYDKKYQQMQKLEKQVEAETEAEVETSTTHIEGTMTPQQNRQRQLKEKKAREEAEIEMQRLKRQAEQAGFTIFDPNKYLKQEKVE